MKLSIAALVLLLQAVISVQTELVAVPVAVTNRAGEHIGGLTARDFQIFDNGRAQPITVFHHGDAPVTIGLVVDRSGSMRSKKGILLVAVSGLLRETRPDDEVFGVGFGDGVSFALPPSQPFTSDAGQVLTALSAMATEGRTALYDGVAAGLAHLNHGRTGRRVLIVVSDGGDNASRATSAEVLRLAQQSDAVIYAIGILGSAPDEDDQDAGLITRLCRDTGGVAYFPKTPGAILTASRQVARDIREQYTIGFAPASRRGAPAFRRIEVRVSGPAGVRLHIRTRRGYVAHP